MIWVDYCIIAIVFASTLVGVIRGFTRETLSLLTWVFAFLLAYLFGDLLAERLDGLISVPSLRLATAYAGLFFGGLVFGAVVTHLLAGPWRWFRAAARLRHHRAAGISGRDDADDPGRLVATIDFHQSFRACGELAAGPHAGRLATAT